VGRLEARGAHVHVPRADQDYAIEVGLRMLRLRHLIAEQDGLLSADRQHEVLLRYYANSIAHLLAGPAAARPAETPRVAVS
jgi:glycerol-3-phosphate O-acyltransferase